MPDILQPKYQRTPSRREEVPFFGFGLFFWLLSTLQNGFRLPGFSLGFMQNFDSTEPWNCQDGKGDSRKGPTFNLLRLWLNLSAQNSDFLLETEGCWSHTQGRGHFLAGAAPLG